MVFTKHRVCDVRLQWGLLSISNPKSRHFDADAMQVQSYLQLCTEVAHQIFFKVIVIDWCQVMGIKEHYGYRIDHATGQGKRPGKMFKEDGRDEAVLDHSGDLW